MIDLKHYDEPEKRIRQGLDSLSQIVVPGKGGTLPFPAAEKSPIFETQSQEYA